MILQTLSLFSMHSIPSNYTNISFSPLIFTSIYMAVSRYRYDYIHTYIKVLLLICLSHPMSVVVLEVDDLEEFRDGGHFKYVSSTCTLSST